MTQVKFPNYKRVTSKSFVSWNEEMFKKYNNERVYSHSNPVIRFVERRRVLKILQYLSPLRASDYILAAGCGEGYIEKKIPKAKILLIDISQEAISRAKHTLADKKRYKFLKADLEKIPCKDNLFDKIECSEVVEHVLSPKRVFDEFHRVLKDRGELIISFPNEPLINFIKKILILLGVFYIFFPNIPKDMTEEWHLRSYTLNKFRRDVDKKWEIKKISGIPFNLLPIRYVVCCKKKL